VLAASIRSVHLGNLLGSGHSRLKGCETASEL
jgi:hypothetical protein